MLYLMSGLYMHTSGMKRGHLHHNNNTPNTHIQHTRLSPIYVELGLLTRAHTHSHRNAKSLMFYLIFPHFYTAPYEYSVHGALALPAGLSINSTTGVISGVATAASGAYPVQVRLSADTRSCNLTHSYSLQGKSTKLYQKKTQLNRGIAAMSLMMCLLLNGKKTITYFMQEMQKGIVAVPLSSGVLFGS